MIRNVSAGGAGGPDSLTLQLVESVAEIEAALGDIQSAQDSAYQAQGHELGAQAAELSARLSQAQYFPADFVEDSKWWTGGNGQAGTPEAAADNPLPGTFVDVTGEARVYQTEATPENCNAFGPIGLIAGVPGVKITLRARIRALTDNTGGAPSTVGLALIHLDAPINYIAFTPGAGLDSHTVADGWQEVAYEFTVPAVGAVGYAPYYRPSLFYNVVGASTDPLAGSNDPQGNQQFQIAWFSILLAAPGAASATPKLIKYLSGSGNYTPSVGVAWVEVELKGAGGGGGGSGTGSPTDGGNGGNTTFKGWAANGGQGGKTSTGGWGAGGNGGTVTAGSGDNGYESRDGQYGFNCPDGYTYALGGSGGGGMPSIAGKYFSTPTLPANSGLGGPGGGTDAGAKGGGGGGEGGYVRFMMSATNLGTSAIAYAVGAGGAGGAAGDGAAGVAGAAGCISIVEHFS